MLTVLKVPNPANCFPTLNLTAQVIPQQASLVLDKHLLSTSTRRQININRFPAKMGIGRSGS